MISSAGTPAECGVQVEIYVIDVQLKLLHAIMCFSHPLSAELIHSWCETIVSNRTCALDRDVSTRYTYSLFTVKSGHVYGAWLRQYRAQALSNRGKR
jgi:hypothetical protein